VSHDERRIQVEALDELDAGLRQQAFEALREQGKPVLPALIEALESRSPLLRCEAARLIGAIAEDLARRPIPDSPPEPPPRPRQVPESLAELVVALESPDQLWRKRVEAVLSHRRAEALPLLLETLESYVTVHPARLIRRLGEWGDLRAVGPLLGLWDELASGDARMSLLVALARLAQKLVEHPLELSDADLLRFVIFARKEMALADAETLGSAICRRATLRPTPALCLLLPHLKGNWLHPAPRSFATARTVIHESSMLWADLPLPATEPDGSDNLPRPSEEKST
jgi:hypothetical protein